MTSTTLHLSRRQAYLRAAAIAAGVLWLALAAVVTATLVGPGA